MATVNCWAYSSSYLVCLKYYEKMGSCEMYYFTTLILQLTVAISEKWDYKAFFLCTKYLCIYIVL